MGASLAQLDATVLGLQRAGRRPDVARLELAVPTNANLSEFSVSGDQLVRVTLEGTEVIRIAGKVVHAVKVG